MTQVRRAAQETLFPRIITWPSLQSQWKRENPSCAIFFAGFIAGCCHCCPMIPEQSLIVQETHWSQWTFLLTIRWKQAFVYDQFTQNSETFFLLCPDPAYFRKILHIFHIFPIPGRYVRISERIAMIYSGVFWIIKWSWWWWDYTRTRDG